MKEHSNINEVFVFGAGASNAKVNLPLGNELVWQLPLSNNRYLLDKDFVSFLKIASIEYNELECEIDRYRKPREESQLYMPSGFVYKDKKYYVDEILRRVINKGNIEHVSLIKKLIILHINSLSRNSENSLYETFVKKCHLDKTRIITFNFDTLLSQAFTKNDIWVDYKFCFSHNHGLPSEAFVKDWPRVSILKLNGSLDWGICYKCGNSKRYIEEVEYNNYGICSKCRSGYEPLIVIPYDHDKSIFKNLMSEAQDILANAKSIIIIGYSFPDYDKYIIELFSESIQKNDNVNLTIVDYCNKNSHQNIMYNKIKNRYKSIFKKEPYISLDGFESFLGKYNNTQYVCDSKK